MLAKTLEAEKLKFELARLKRMSFGAIVGAHRARDRAAGAEARGDRDDSGGRRALRRGLGARSCTGRIAREEAAPQAARASAAPRGDARARHLRLPALRLRAPAQGRRGRDRGAGVRARPLRGGAPRAAGLLVRQVRGDGAGAHAGDADPARHGRRQRPRPRDHVEVRRPSSALSPGRDLRARRRRSRSRHARRLGGQGGVAVAPARRADRRARDGGHA